MISSTMQHLPKLPRAKLKISFEAAKLMADIKNNTEKSNERS
tara:strand:- start:1127 stop:1252 length:126 start_codon:yes stop_codon:yes gene_type:complete